MTQSARIMTSKQAMSGATANQPPFGTYAPKLLQRVLIGLARHSFLHRGAFRERLTHIIMGKSGTPLDTSFRGCNYRLMGQSNLIEYGILLNPKYNAADINFLIEGAEPGANFIDIGSNIGLYALSMAKTAGSAGTLIAIDANPMMAQMLSWNAAASNLANVRMFACAVSDKDGYGELLVHNEDVAIVGVVEGEGGSIPVRTLGTIVSEVGITSIYGLKIDIEGHEDKALAPFIQSSPDSLLPKRIVIEHPKSFDDYPACERAFTKRGYVLVGQSRNNSFYRRGG
ncbi:MAG: FkbM family methyltransferase [Rhizobiaceae bacterium]